MKHNTAIKIEETFNHTLSKREYKLIQWAYSHGYASGHTNGLDGIFISSSAIQDLLGVDLQEKFDTQDFVSDLD
ncbi:hypothetical protein [Pseudoalteromonas piscicida]|uniref:Uncharacterized protein n=1 Tax=Pseudoalteromonas piscicida TaxID=43662 RepID=A0AAD0RJ98_PSEO7|nr:hypothetical protein [Pseudoalteromonas piscicida]ASD68750.1 hypothetical protein B1L02_18135 [Pseudoalteromonas piscicida]AXQ99495.1 hypothetical protein D0N37_18430 [Pseudoalteromonas piscicida]AXR03810.1 hypothetical protein D0511_18220 [Pseudoalteromonas piscicida]